MPGSAGLSRVDRDQRACVRGFPALFAIGAASRALLGSMRDVGISDAFVSDVRQEVTPGTSALFVLSSGAVYDKIAVEFRGTDAELIRTNLSDEKEAKLREAFGLED